MAAPARLLSLVRRRGLLVVGAVALAAFVWARFLRPVEVEVGRVERGTVVAEAFGRGTIESEREAAVGFDLVGRLSEVLVEEGDRVTLGQELARLETDQAQAELRSAQVGVAAARASLTRLAAEEERARALLAGAEREAARAESLFAASALSSQERDAAADKARVARADLDRLLAARSEATRGIELAAGGAEQRRVAMVRATLLAPFDGVVTRRLRDPGDTVTVGSTVLRIVDAGRVRVAAAVDETVLPRLAVDQPAPIWFPGAREPVPGKVASVAWESDRQTHELLVEVVPEKLERRVAIGQRADVRIELERREGVLRLPLALLHRDEAGSFVYADRGGRIAVVRPGLGLTGAAHVEVTAGLAEGDVLLASPRAGAALPEGRRWKAK